MNCKYNSVLWASFWETLKYKFKITIGSTDMLNWMIVYPLFTCVNVQGRSYMKRNAYNEIYSLNVCICLTTAWITDGSHWWQIGITFILLLDPKIVLPYRCQILRLMKKTPPQSIMPTESEYVFVPHNAPFNSPELCIERRTLASHSSALLIRL